MPSGIRLVTIYAGRYFKGLIGEPQTLEWKYIAVAKNKLRHTGLRKLSIG